MVQSATVPDGAFRATSAMSRYFCILFIVVFAIWMTPSGELLAQTTIPAAGVLKYSDLATIKQRAEAGDAVAQAKLGQTLAESYRPIEALDWYRKAAAQGNVEAEYQLGKMLLFGSPGQPAQLSVKQKAPEGLRFTFMAATNLHPYACWNMAKAMRQGLGTSTNLVEAYAWLTLFSQTSAGSFSAQFEMNDLALQLDTDSLRQARNLATLFRAGQWAAPVLRAVPEGDPRLKLNGITFGTKHPLAVINGKTFSPGESAQISVKPGWVTIECLKVEKDSVLISIEGEDGPRLLRMK